MSGKMFIDRAELSMRQHEEIESLREQVKGLSESKKQMLDEIRQQINGLCEYKSFVRVEGDPVPTLPQIEKWCVIWILDEMEAKL